MKTDDKSLLVASKHYAEEIRSISWWHLVSTVVCLISLLAISAFHTNLLAAICSSILAGFVLVRMFVLYHDYLHGAILRNSSLAEFIFNIYGIAVLTPPVVWKASHDSHHQNNCRSFGNEMGSFPLITTKEYTEMSPNRRLGYRVIRNPLVIAFGYLTSFFWNKCLRHFVQQPIKYYMAGIALAIHVACLIALGMYSFQALLLGGLLPLFLGCGVGTYLFYAQHNFPGMQRMEGEQWNYVDAALLSSSYLKTGSLLAWLTGNIGYHHVHHINAKIPFYRLPEAMNGMSELQNPTTTSLGLEDIYGCLRLKLWDSDRNRLISFSEADKYISKHEIKTHATQN